MTELPPPAPGASRRDFIAKTGAAAAVSAIGFPSVIFGAENDKKLKVGLIGCGGRGTGAAAQALMADDNVELHAMGDVYEDQALTQLRVLARDRQAASKIGSEVQSTKHVFGGLDSYLKVMDTGVDVVLLTTPPGFRPQHFKEAVDRGIHCFVEKPCASDVAGVLDFMATGQVAAQKGVSVLAGLCYRYSDHARLLFDEQIRGGAIGEIRSMHGTYFANIVKPMPPEEDRPAGMSDTEWQVRNWYNFTWLSGDGLVEQGIHTVDRMSWLLEATTGEKNPKPVACYAQGGRQRPNHAGNTYDHYAVTYEWEGGLRCHVDWNQYGAGAYKENKDFIFGTKGTAHYDIGSAEVTGENPWIWRRPRTGGRNMYQVEHDEFFASIRKGERHADEDLCAHATLLSIMGRMAAYTGKRITWDDVIGSGEKLVPDPVEWDAALPVPPIPIPGVAETQPA